MNSSSGSGQVNDLRLSTEQRKGLSVMLRELQQLLTHRPSCELTRKALRWALVGSQPSESRRELREAKRVRTTRVSAASVGH